MKYTTLLTLALATLCTGNVWAQETVNLTPLPKEIQVGTGMLTMPQEFSINMNGLADSVKAEVEKFVEDYTKVTGAKVSISNSGDEKTLINMSLNNGASKMGPEAYKLKITEQQINIEAETTRGFFYAFQSLKKLLPPCVMAGVKDPNVTELILPVVDINDAPKFAYRGYMLDVCRHFFTVDEVKRILDVMSYYKMNKFHWHLTEDQGWRVEIKKYPKLTSVASVRDFSWNTEYKPGGTRYRTYEPYGPYFYTQEEIKEVVAYAQKLHIDIIPEVDMPGHFSAAMAAYPEFSCYPDGSHNIPCDGGIYSDILNVANPKAVQFAKDILDELMDLFPYPYFHIGGDECPTNAWQNNKECQELMKELGYGTNYRKLQSRFIQQMAEHAAKRGRTLYVWNEAISASGADLDMIKSTGAHVMCWTGADAAAQKAAGLGLHNVLTPQPTLYINRKAGTDPNEPHAVGPGTDATLQQVYNYNPGAGVNASLQKYYTGVQGTFWTEHVSEAQHVEYLTFPRLIAIAETGWSPTEKKNFDDFCNRMKQDTVLLNYNNYQYAPYYLTEQTMVFPISSTDENMFWYRLVTMATDNYRNDKCIELLREGAPQIGTGDAKVNRLWNGVAANEGEDAYDYQMWALMEDPENPGKYALVCKAKPNGSVNPVATAQAANGRWDYDENNRHYGFMIDKKEYFGKVGNNYYYSIRSDKSNAGLYMNMGFTGQNYAINQYTDPKDGSSGLWEFQPQSVDPNAELQALLKEANMLIEHAAGYESSNPEIGKYDPVKIEALKAAVNKEEVVKEEVSAAIEELKASLCTPKNGDQIRISNSVEGSYKGLALMDDAGLLRTTDSKWASDIWIVETENAGNFALKNLSTGNYISGNTNPLTTGTSKTNYKYSFNTEEQDFTLTTNEGKALFPVSKDYATHPGCIYVDGIRIQGAAWNMEKVWQITYQCVDEDGNDLGTFSQAATAGKDAICTAPEIKNFEAVSYNDGDATAPTIEAINKNETVKVTYKRTSYSIVTECIDEMGNRLMQQETNCKIGESINLTYPEIAYYQFKEGSVEPGKFTPEKDEVLTAVYTTEALHFGFKAVDQLITEPEAGKTYLLYDSHMGDSRNGFLNVADNGKIFTTETKSGTPAYVWTLESAGTGRFKVKASNNKYIPQMPHGNDVYVQSVADVFTFTLNADKETWNIKGTNGEFWNGNPGKLTGWSDAHPYKIFSIVPMPYFEVKCSYTDTEGNAMTQLKNTLSIVKAGDSYSLEAPEVEGYETPTVNVTAEELEAVSKNINIQVVYKKKEGTGIEDINLQKKNDGKLYDLNGRELNKANNHGIYIQNGEKIIR